MSLSSLLSRIAALSRAPLSFGADLLDLGIRLYVGQVFFLSGLQKIRNWDNTLALFSDEYHVPVLPSSLAAVLGTFGELVFPVFLVLGLGTRFAALGLTLVNLMAVVSYWHVLSMLAPALAQHVFWGTLLLVTLFHGPGRLSLDQLVAPRLGLGAVSGVTASPARA
jgi:putative oxidoreductase